MDEKKVSIDQLVLYRNLKYGGLFREMAALMGAAKTGTGAEPDPFSCAGQLVELAAEYGFEGNLWHCFLALCLAENENAYSQACEIAGAAGGTLDQLARRDYIIWKGLFDFDLRKLEPEELWGNIACYHPAGREGHVFNRRIRDRIVSLAVQQIYVVFNTTYYSFYKIDIYFLKTPHFIGWFYITFRKEDKGGSAL